MTNFKPLFNNILIKRIEDDNKTAGGIIIPDSAKEKPARGQVVATGQGAINEQGERIAVQVKAGDIVIFAKWGGTDLKLDGEDFIILKDTDILGIVA